MRKSEGAGVKGWSGLVSLRRLALGTTVIGLTQLAGFCGPTDPGPCSSDRFNCDDGDASGFVQKTECQAIATPLTLELGGGYDTLMPFDTSSAPPFERGGQGGQHLTMAYRVVGADLAQSDRLRVSLRLYQRGFDCGGDLLGDASAGSSSDAGSELCEEGVGDRVMIRGGETFPLKPDANGDIVETGVIVILDAWGQVRAPFKVVGLVEDLCGRSATAEVVFADFLQ